MGDVDYSKRKKVAKKLSAKLSFSPLQSARKEDQGLETKTSKV